MNSLWAFESRLAGSNCLFSLSLSLSLSSFCVFTGLLSTGGSYDDQRPFCCQGETELAKGLTVKQNMDANGVDMEEQPPPPLEESQTDLFQPSRTGNREREGGGVGGERGMG